jgi:two-component system NtrC family response regulator
VGHSRELKSDFRLVAATNRDLDHMVAQGDFRQDLLFRIRTLMIELPPLKERGADIKELIFYHTNRLCERYEIAPKGYSPECLTALTTYTWPGNVRELVNTLESTITAALNESTIYAKHLPTEIRIQIAAKLLAEKRQAEAATGDGDHRPLPTFKDFISEAKRQYLEDLMQQAQGDTRRACDIADLPRSTLYDQLKKAGIPRSK